VTTIQLSALAAPCAGVTTTAAAAPVPAKPLCLSDPVDVALCVYRGDTGTFRITLTDTAGTPVDISTATWDADIRVLADDVAPVCSFTVTPVVGIPEAVDVTLTAVDSALLDLPAYVYDVQMTLGTVVQTLVAGPLTTTKDVSR
jgi:hypothetical protein